MSRLQLKKFVDWKLNAHMLIDKIYIEQFIFETFFNSLESIRNPITEVKLFTSFHPTNSQLTYNI